MSRWTTVLWQALVALGQAEYPYSVSNEDVQQRRREFKVNLARRRRARGLPGTGRTGMGQCRILGHRTTPPKLARGGRRKPTPTTAGPILDVHRVLDAHPAVVTPNQQQEESR